MGEETGTMDERVMLLDVQDEVCQKIFQGELTCVETRFSDEGMACTLRQFDRSPEMAKAAVVCKSWHQKHREYLKEFFAKEEERLWQTAVADGLAMCGLALYGADDPADIPMHTEHYHSVYMSYGTGEEICVLDLHLTRWQPDADEDYRQTLAVQAWTADMLGPAEVTLPALFENMPVRVTPIPPWCWQQEEELSTLDLQTVQEWKEYFKQETLLWLPTQRDAEGQAAEIAAWRRDFGAFRQTFLANHGLPSPEY